MQSHYRGERGGEYCKNWTYTSDDYEADSHAAPSQPTIFSRYLDEAHDYAKGLADPHYVNWVRVDWLWI